MKSIKISLFGFIAVVFLSTVFVSPLYAIDGDKSTAPEKSKAFTLDLKIQNPLKVNNIQDAIKLGLGFVMKIAIPVIIVLLIWSGFLFVFALGNKDKITKAKNNFLYTLIGAGLVLGAYTIAIAIINTVNSLTQ